MLQLFHIISYNLEVHNLPVLIQELSCIMKRQKNNIHVLDWGKIAESNSGEQVSSDESKNKNRTVNKGILFEDMVERLLSAMFPEEIWKRTGESHDGKRDFVYPAEEYLKEQKWAECKNYNSKLSINIIAPTLIMGAIKNIECIFFFSYSPLNDTAIENLLSYSEMEKSLVKIFDGNLLESLICRYHDINGLDEFFPNTDFKKAYVELEKKQLRIIKTLYDLNGNKIPSTHRFELGELFYIHIIIQNLAWKPLDLEISFQVGNQRILRCCNNTSMVSLSFAGIEGYSALCEALSSGSTSCMAKIIVNGNVKKVSERITVIDEPYLAWSGENAFKVLEEGRNHLVERSLQPLFIVGESGTGKSTLTEILLQQKQIREFYRVLKIDLTLARNNCMRNLFSQIFGMCGKEMTPKEQMEDDEIALSLLVSSYAESADMIARTMMEFYSLSKPYLFVVDDVQKISRPFISLFQELDNQVNERNCPIYYLFVLNEEEASLDELLSRLSWDTNYQNRKYHIIKTTKFRKKDILTYMKTRYGLEGIDQYFDSFEKEITPLELHSFCAGLKKERIIARIPGKKTYQVINHFKFFDGIQQILYAEIPLKKICDKLDKGGQAEFLLKYLYIADTFSPNMEAKYVAILQGLMDQGVLREKDGAITFYHDKIRTAIGITLMFSEEDYADIFASCDIDDAAKAICALEQIGRLRNGTDFLKVFFSSDGNIRKGEQRHQICKLIFQHLEKLSNVGLASAALQFVKIQFTALREEQGHKTFFHFLNHIADSALESTWDVDEKCVENMAFFIKKFFDRALSTYNYRNCLNYFKKYEKIFNELKYISESRRNFWLSNYANRAAIALDRESIPLTAEPISVTELYKRSEFYSEQADDPNQLVLQITVDNFNRHYVYRHNLTIDIVHNIHRELIQFKDNSMTNSMVLDYHLLLLEYLSNQMDFLSVYDTQDLLNRVRNTRQRSTSAFYTIKLSILEITILSNLHCWSEATRRLSQTFEFAYKKEMRSYVYKLTYIKTHLIIFEKDSANSPEVYQQAVLAMEQMIDTHGNMIQNLKRESFLLVRLMQIIMMYKPDEVSSLISNYSQDNQELLYAICAHIQGKSNEMDELFYMQSFFVVEGISFPTI